MTVMTMCPSMTMLSFFFRLSTSMICPSLCWVRNYRPETESKGTPKWA